LQDFGSQSSQIGPHLVQPLSRRPIAITLKISANRLNIIHDSTPRDYTARSRAFSSHGTRVYNQQLVAIVSSAVAMLCRFTEQSSQRR
jgi:hypothetical protein